jgi:hypothetical protein
MHDAVGWVAGATNGPGIQGSFYPFSDADAGGATTITMGDFAMSPTSACASGMASQVQMAMFGTYWGGGIGLNLADPGVSADRDRILVYRERDNGAYRAAL